jgi:hypothetical protein
MMRFRIGLGSRAGILLATLPLWFLGCSEGSSPRVVVSPHGDGDCRTVAEALRRVAPGGLILVRPGEYRESLTLRRPVDLVAEGASDEVTIVSDRTHTISIEGDGIRVSGFTVVCEAEATPDDVDGMDAVRITGGAPVIELCRLRADDGAGGLVRGTSANPTFRRCTFEEGGRVGLWFRDGARGTVEEAIVAHNLLGGVTVVEGAQATLVGLDVSRHSRAALAIESASASLEDCVIHDNGSTGVDIGPEADVHLRRCRIHDGLDDGVLISQGGKGTIEDCEISDNRGRGVVTRDGSEVLIRDSHLHGHGRVLVDVGVRSTGVVESCDLRGEDLQEVAAVSWRASSLTLRDCEILAGHSTSVLVQENAEATLERCRLRGGRSHGVWVHGDSRCWLEDCLVEDHQGNGVSAIFGSEIEVVHTLIRGSGGDGLHFEGTGNGLVEGCEISGSAKANVVVSYNSDPTLRGCRIFGAGGNGIDVSHWARGTFEDCDITGNSWSGVGVSILSRPTLQRCRIFDNSPFGIRVLDRSGAQIEACDLRGNANAGLSVDESSSAARRLNVGEAPTGSGLDLRGDVTVDPEGGGDFRSIKQALQAVEPGATVHVRPGVYEDKLEISTPVSIVGDGPVGEIVIRGTQWIPVLIEGRETTLRGLTVLCEKPYARDDPDALAASVWIEEGNVILEDCVFSSTSVAGVVVHSAKASCTLRRCLIHDCEVDGVNITREATVTLEDCEIANSAVGIYTSIRSSVTARRTRIHSGRGIAVLLDDFSRGVLEECNLRGNAQNHLAVVGGAHVEARACVIERGAWCGVCVDGGSAVIDDTTITDNGASGIWVGPNSEATLRGCRVTDNARFGVSLTPTGRAIVEDCTLRANGLGAWAASAEAVMQLRGNQLDTEI